MAALKKQRRKDMTEQEAKTKWCPMVRFQIGPDNPSWQNVAYSNRGDYFDNTCTGCIASACMMWRWEVPEGKATNKNEEKWDSGYCGLAGKP
jgi:hypothetical protein